MIIAVTGGHGFESVGCLASKQCSASSLNCRYLSLYIKLKLTELAIQLNQEF